MVAQRLLYKSCCWLLYPELHSATTISQDAIQILLRNRNLLLEHQYRRCSRQVSTSLLSATHTTNPLPSDHATSFNNTSSNATIPSSIVSLASDASVPVSTASADATSAGGAFASAEVALNSALSVATAAAASYISVLPTKNLFGTTDPTGTPDEHSSDATRGMTASMMGVGMVLVVALVL